MGYLDMSCMMQADEKSTGMMVEKRDDGRKWQSQCLSVGKRRLAFRGRNSTREEITQQITGVALPYQVHINYSG